MAQTLWFVGLTTLDVVHRSAVPASRDQKVTASWQGVAAGGPAANAAVVAARLGERAILITAIGDGPIAEVVRADLATQGVTVIDLADEQFQLAVSAILVDEATGERSVVSPDGGQWPGPQPHAFTNALTSNSVVGANETTATDSPGNHKSTLSPVTAKDTTERSNAAFPEAILFDGHHLGIIRQVIEWLTQQQKQPLIILDGGRWKPIFTELFPIADVAALSNDFIVPNYPNALTGGLALGAKSVVITNGGNPVKWQTKEDNGAVTPPQVKATDTLGAGDFFHGALTVALAHQKPLPAAITFANQIAALRVQHLGSREWLNYLGTAAVEKAENTAARAHVTMMPAEQFDLMVNALDDSTPIPELVALAHKPQRIIQK